MLRNFSHQIQTGQSLVHETSFSNMGVMSSELEEKFERFREKFFPNFYAGKGHSVITLWLGLETRLEYLHTSANLLSTSHRGSNQQPDAVHNNNTDKNQQEKPMEDEGWDKEDIEAMQGIPTILIKSTVFLKCF